jgi:hypothetical protein
LFANASGSKGELDACIAQSTVKTTQSDDRPPVVEKDFQRSPIGDPTKDNQAFTERRTQTRVPKAGDDKFAYGDTREENR